MKYFDASSELAGAEQLAGEVPSGELAAGAAGAVHHQHGVADDAAFVLPRLPERPVVDAQLGQRLAGGELKVLEDEVAFDNRQRRRALRRLQDPERCDEAPGQHRPRLYGRSTRDSRIASYCSAKFTVTVMITGIGTPLSRVGENCHCLTASSAA